MNKRRPALSLYLTLLIVFIIAIAGIGCGEDPPPPPPEKTGFLYVGLVVPQSGPLKEIGTSMIRGAEMAVGEVNAEKGRKRKVKLLLEDETKRAPDTKRLGCDPRVAIMVGHVTEKSLAGSRDMYVECGRPVLLPIISSNRAPALGGGFFFQMMVSDLDQASVLAEFARKELGADNAMIIHEDSDYGRSLSEVFGTKFQQAGGNGPTIISYPEDPQALLDLASRAAEEKPDVVFLAMHSRPAVYAAQALARAEIKPAFLGTHALALADAAALLGGISDKFYVTLPYNPLDPGKSAAVIIKEFGEKHHRAPDWTTLLTYEAVKLAVTALDKAGDDPKKVKSYLNGLSGSEKSYKGRIGDFYFIPGGKGSVPVSVVPLNSSLIGRVP